MVVKVILLVGYISSSNRDISYIEWSLRGSILHLVLVLPRIVKLWVLYFRFSPENTELLTTLGLLYLQVRNTAGYYVDLIIF